MDFRPCSSAAPPVSTTLEWQISVTFVAKVARRLPLAIGIKQTAEKGSAVCVGGLGLE